MKITIFIIASFLASFALAAAPPSGDYELHEWVIFVTDANQPNANALTEFKSSLPSFVSDRRTNADEKASNDPMPIGVIRILGNVPTDDQQKIDVLLEMKSGQFNGHWPKAESKSTRLLWKDMTASKNPPRMGDLDPKSWFKKLRDGQSDYLSFNGSGDRCLVYDAEVPFKMPIKVTGDGPTYKVSNTSEYTLKNLEFYRPTESGWSVALVPELKATQPHSAPKPAASQSTTGPATRHALTPDEAKSVFASDSPRATTRPAMRSGARSLRSMHGTSRPSSQASSQPSTMPSETIVLHGTDAKSIPLDAWKDRIAATGLAPVDTDLILSILQNQASDKKRMTAIAQLDRGDLDRLIPEDVVPTPRKTVRVGLVVLKNIDPSILKEVDQLITQLGDTDWNKREAATKALAELGRAAEPQLQSATKNKDVEIAFRAEKLVKAIKSGNPG